MLDVNIHKTNKVVLALKRKKAKARTNAKKSDNTALLETREWKTYLFGPRNSKIVYQLRDQLALSLNLGTFQTDYKCINESFAFRSG